MKLALFLLIWGLPAFLYIVLPLILWAVEIPLLRRLRNYTIGNGFTPCTHERVVQTGFYSGKCVDCEAEMGEGSRRKFTKAELEMAWENMQQYEADRLGQRKHQCEIP